VTTSSSTHAALRRRVAAGATLLLALAATSCSVETSGGSTPAAPSPDSPSASQTSQAPQTPAVKVLTKPAARATGVTLETPVTVTAERGTLTSVKVTSPEGEVTGRLGSGKAEWTSTGRLQPGTTYTVRTVAENTEGKVRRATSTFSTVDLTLDQQTYPSVAPLAGETVGVGMPVIVTFDVPVTDHAAFERRMKVTSTPAQKGSWYWMSDQEAHWRPDTYWKAGSDVHVELDLDSVPAGGGIYGQVSRQVDFSIGDAHVYKVNAQTHQMQVYSNGQLLRTLPITTGKPGFTTRSGVKVIMEKFREKRMNSETVGISENDPEYYDIDDVEYAMRLTSSGEFIHAAPWSVASQGNANVSHGCTGMSTDNARWLYDMTVRGDVVEYTGTDRPMTLTNGYGDWNLSAQAYHQGSAL